jgi:hypothetical protein
VLDGRETRGRSPPKLDDQALPPYPARSFAVKKPKQVGTGRIPSGDGSENARESDLESILAWWPSCFNGEGRDTRIQVRSLPAATDACSVAADAAATVKVSETRLTVVLEAL